MMRLYRWLLWLCPTALRREYGAAMEDTFAHRLADARHAGLRRRSLIWRRELSGLFTLAASERWGRAAPAQQRRQAHEAGRKAEHMKSIGHDLRHAARRLARSPAFTLPAVLTLALAIGATASIFAVVQAVILNPLPYPESDRLIELDHGALGLNLPSGMGVTSGLYFHYADRSRTLDHVALYRTEDVTLTGSGEPERIRVARATPSLAPVLGVHPALGRWFTDEEGEPGAAPVAVLSHRLWTRRYHGSPHALGRLVILEGTPMQIVGVMPASYAFPDPQVGAWIVEPVSKTTGFGLWTYKGVARVSDRPAIAQVRTELNELIAALPGAYPNDAGALGNLETKLVFTGRPLKEATVGSVARAFWILSGAVTVVLLVACANVANLFLVRSEGRQREVALRRALGASGGRIAQYFLVETVLLSVAASAIGLGLAWGGVRLLVSSGPANLPRLHEIQLGGLTVAFTLVLGMLAGLAFGAIPLGRGSAIVAALHEAGRGNTLSPRRHSVRHLLIAAQVTLALVLLVSSGLMVRSFQKLLAVDPGFDPTAALTFSLALPERGYPTRQAAVRGHQIVLERLAILPGVTAVSASSCLPLTGGCFANTLRVEGRTYAPGTVPPLARFRAVASGYFETIGMRLLAGRAIDRGDVERHEPVVVVNEALARMFFPNANPIDQRIASNRPPSRPGEPPQLAWLRVVGVVVNTPLTTLAEANPIPQVFVPMSMAGGPDTPTAALAGPDISTMSYVVRSALPPAGLQQSVRQAVTAVDKNLALARVQTLQEIVDASSSQMAFTMVLLVLASSVTLLLGVIGIYGVMSYIVSQRTVEIGVRLALGASPASVAGLIVRQGGLAASAGLGAGLATAFAGGRLLESLLFDVSPRDPGVFAAAGIALFAIALLACWLPARRASRLNPLEALRAE